MQRFVMLLPFLVSECVGFVPLHGNAGRNVVLEMTGNGIGFEPTRRSFLALSGAAVAGLVTVPEKASAKDELFKPNPLTNPLLEQVRNKDIYVIRSRFD